MEYEKLHVLETMKKMKDRKSSKVEESGSQSILDLQAGNDENKAESNNQPIMFEKAGNIENGSITTEKSNRAELRTVVTGPSSAL